MAINLSNLMVGWYGQAVPSGRLEARRRLVEVYDGIRGDETLAQTISEYRSLLDAEGKASPDVDLFKKTRIPAFTSAGVIVGNRANGWPAAHSGLYQLDIELKHGGGLDRLAAAVKRLPYAVLVYQSPSRGVKAMLRGTPPPEPVKEAAEREWRGVMRRACLDLGLPVDLSAIDTKVKDVQRLCFMSFDPEACFNPMAAVCDPDYPPPEPPPPSQRRGSLYRGVQAQAEPDRMRLLAEVIAQALPPPGSGSYNLYVGAAAALKALGWSEAAVNDWALSGGRGAVQYTWASLPACQDPGRALGGIAKSLGCVLPRSTAAAGVSGGQRRGVPQAAAAVYGKPAGDYGRASGKRRAAAASATMASLRRASTAAAAAHQV